MSKYYGIIGFAETEETVPGVWQNVITEKYYSGDILRNTKRWQTAQKVNDDLNISNSFSIIASDPYIVQNFGNIRYLTFMGTRWKVTDIEVKFPRLILSVGGLYNGEQA